jgi:hypothetical protein
VTGGATHNKLRSLASLRSITIFRCRREEGKHHETEGRAHHHAARGMAARLPWLGGTGTTLRSRVTASSPCPPTLFHPENTQVRRGLRRLNKRRETEQDPTARGYPAVGTFGPSRNLRRALPSSPATRRGMPRRGLAAASRTRGFRRACSSSTRASSGELGAPVQGMLSVVHPPRVGGECARFVAPRAPSKPPRATLLGRQRTYHAYHHVEPYRGPQTERTCQ